MNCDACLEVIKDLERKAEQEREKYSILARKQKNIMNSFSTTALITSILVAFLSVADPRLLGLEDKQEFFIYLTLLGFILTFITICDRLLNVHEKYASYHFSISILTEYIRDSHKYRHTEMKSDSEDVRLSRTNDFENAYVKMVRSLPQTDLTPKQFLTYKQILSIKIQASKKIDEDPMTDLTPEVKMINKLNKRF